MNPQRSLDEAAIAGRLLPLARTWRRMADRALEEHGLSAAIAWALTHLDRLHPEVRQIDLAEAMEISPASLVPLLRQLEATGLVQRVVDPADRRTRRLALTENGRSVVIESEKALAALRRRLLSDVDDATLRILADTLEKMSNTPPVSGRPV